MDLYSRNHGELGSLPKWKEKQTRTGLEVSCPEVQSNLQLCYQSWKHQGDLGSLRVKSHFATSSLLQEE